MNKYFVTIGIDKPSPIFKSFEEEATSMASALSQAIEKFFKEEREEGIKELTIIVTLL